LIPTNYGSTLKDRGIDFADAVIVFTGLTLDFEDNRKDYGETRIITVGHLNDRMMIVAKDTA
jgi:uncharacterized DUF497 family protein